MANSFDRFPVGDELVKGKTAFMSAEWTSFMESFYQNLVGYLSQNGIFIPNLTQTQIDLILKSSIPINGVQSPGNAQLVYNTTIDAPQFYQVSSKSWRTISFT